MRTDGDALGVDGTQVAVLEQLDHEVLHGLHTRPSAPSQVIAVRGGKQEEKLSAPGGRGVRASCSASSASAVQRYGISDRLLEISRTYGVRARESVNPADKARAGTLREAARSARAPTGRRPAVCATTHQARER